jgi:hypothetical protein
MAKESDLVFYSIVIFGIVGVIIVIASFFITMPEEESYSELYFNLPHMLPKNLAPGDEALVHWSIVNHENQKQSYNYRIMLDEYKLYPQTEESFRCYSKYLPKKVEEKRQTSYYKTADFSKEDVCGDMCDEYGLSEGISVNRSTRAIEQNYSSSPVMYKEYSISYEARAINGSGQHFLSFLSRTGYRKWGLFIDPLANKSIFIGNNKQTLIEDIEWNFSYPNDVVLRLSPGEAEVMVNNITVFEASELWDYTDGIITLDIINSTMNIYRFDIIDEEVRTEKPREIVKYSISRPIRRVKSNKTSEVEYISSYPSDFVEYRPDSWRFFNSSGIVSEYEVNDLIPSSRIRSLRIPESYKDNSFSFSYVALDGKGIVRAGMLDIGSEIIFLLSIDEKRNEMTLLSFEDNGIAGYKQTANISDGQWHRIEIENKDRMIVRYGSRIIFNLSRVDNQGGYAYLETDRTYTHFTGIGIRNLEVIEPLSPTVFNKVFIIDEDECEKKLVGRRIIDEGTIEIADEGRKLSKFSFSPEDDYEFIRIKVELINKGQDILFWMER